MALFNYKGIGYLREDDIVLRLMEILDLPEDERPKINMLIDRGDEFKVVEGMEVLSYREGHDGEHVFSFAKKDGFPPNSTFVVPGDRAKIGMGKYPLWGIYEPG